MDDLERLKDLQRVLAEGGNGQGQLTHIRRDYCKEMADVLGRHIQQHSVADPSDPNVYDDKIGGTCWPGLEWSGSFSLTEIQATKLLDQDDFF